MDLNPDKDLDIETRLEMASIDLEFARKLIDELSDKIDKAELKFGGK
jgi:hypothetical protein